MPQSPAPVMMHVLVDRIDIVHGPSRSRWLELQDEVGAQNKEVEVRFIVRTPASPSTFTRTFIVAEWVAFNPSGDSLTFGVDFTGRRLIGRFNLKTGKGYVLTS